MAPATNEQMDFAPAARSILGSPANLMQTNLDDGFDLSLTDDIFLEDTFLHHFTYDASGSALPTIPAPTPVATPVATSDMMNAHSETTQPGPSEAAQESEYRPVHSNALQIEPHELETFHTKLAQCDINGDLAAFKRPGLSRTLRCIISYFRHFDPHTPIIHYASFKISETACQ